MEKFCVGCGRRERFIDIRFSEIGGKWFCNDCFLDLKKMGALDIHEADIDIEVKKKCFNCGGTERFLDIPFRSVNGGWFCNECYFDLKKQNRFPTAEQIAERKLVNLRWIDFPNRNDENEIKRAKKVQKISCEKTNNQWMGSLVHLGGHPRLPIGERLVLGLSRNEISFFDYGLHNLSASPLSNIQATTDTRHFSSTSFGTTYVPKGSPVGSTLSSQRIDIHPDTLIISLFIKGIEIQCQFDTRPYDALVFTQWINYMRLESA